MKSSLVPVIRKHARSSSPRGRRRRIFSHWGPRCEVSAAAWDSGCAVVVRSIGALFPVHGNGARELLRRDAAEPTDFYRNDFGASYPLRIGPTTSGEIRALAVGGCTRGPRILHRL